MIARNAKFSAAAALGGLLALTAFAAPSYAGYYSDIDAKSFCQAIGLEPEQRQDCADQMMSANTPDDADQVAAAMVAHSPLAVRKAEPSSLYEPPTDANKLNGTPGTPYQDKTNVSNQVNAQIHRALKIDHLE